MFQIDELTRIDYTKELELNRKLSLIEVLDKENRKLNYRWLKLKEEIKARRHIPEFALLLQRMEELENEE